MEHLNENEELYRAWIGTKKQDKYIEKMRRGGFSWAAFFLRDLLFLTRKMFVETIVLILIVFLINTVMRIIGFPNIAYSIVNFVIAIDIGFSYYHLYRGNIKRKIEKYKAKGLSYEEQLEVARKKGGDNVTVAVVIVVVVLLPVLLLGTGLFMGVISGITSTVNNDTRHENNYETDYNDLDDDSNYDYSYSDNNDDYSSANYDENTYSDTNNKTWKLDSFSLTYSANDWEEMTQDNYKVLKYKDTENYLTYIERNKNDIGLAEIKNENFQDNFEQYAKQQFESSNPNLTYLYSDWEEVDDRLYSCKIHCDYQGDNYINATYYYYFSNTNEYCLMVTESQSDYTFMSAVEDVLDTIKNNSQL